MSLVAHPLEAQQNGRGASSVGLVVDGKACNVNLVITKAPEYSWQEWWYRVDNTCDADVSVEVRRLGGSPSALLVEANKSTKSWEPYDKRPVGIDLKMLLESKLSQEARSNGWQVLGRVRSELARLRTMLAEVRRTGRPVPDAREPGEMFKEYEDELERVEDRARGLAELLSKASGLTTAGSGLGELETATAELRKEAASLSRLHNGLNAAWQLAAAKRDSLQVARRDSATRQLNPGEALRANRSANGLTCRDTGFAAACKPADAEEAAIVTEMRSRPRYVYRPPADTARRTVALTCGGFGQMMGTCGREISPDASEASPAPASGEAGRTGASGSSASQPGFASMLGASMEFQQKMAREEMEARRRIAESEQARDRAAATGEERLDRSCVDRGSYVECTSWRGAIGVTTIRMKPVSPDRDRAAARVLPPRAPTGTAPEGGCPSVGVCWAK